jgi:PAS domain-containing protein
MLLTDIDNRKKAEEELRRSKAYLTEAQRLSRTGTFGCRLLTGEMFWSEETFRIFGYDRSTQPAVERVLQRVHPEDRAWSRNASIGHTAMEKIVRSNVAFYCLTIRSSKSVSWLMHQKLNQESSSSLGR